jgi:hypothetical protein
MGNLKLAEAFRIRAKLKEKISDISQEWWKMRKYTSEQEPEVDESLSGFDCDEILYEYSQLQDILFALNKSIAQANSAGAEVVLLHINSCNDRINFLERSIAEIQRQPKFTERQIEVDNHWETIRKSTTLSVDLPAVYNEVKRLKKDKFDLENSLARWNAETDVEINLPVKYRHYDKEHEEVITTTTLRDALKAVFE